MRVARRALAGLGVVMIWRIVGPPGEL